MGNSVIMDDNGPVVFNDTDVETSAVMESLAANSTSHPAVQAIVRWTLNAQGEGSPPGETYARGTGRAGGLWERDRYLTPHKIFDQMKTAQRAAEADDVVSGVLDTTEALAFSSMSFYVNDEDEEDVWNQWAGDIDLDARLREVWREVFTVSQFTAAIWWGTKTYKVRGTTDAGNQKRKTFANLRVPVAMTILDPLKVVPVGNTIFNQEALAYIAGPAEADAFDRSLGGRGIDPVVDRLVLGRYEPDRAELESMERDGLEVTRNLFLLNPANVFRHTATRPQYRRFADVRLRSVFELLDLKQQLKQMDRAHLIGGTNFIVLIRKGTDDLPARPEEIANLQAQVMTVARVPVMVGDHRLSVEIVTPKLDNTLRPERYNTIDSRLTARLFQMFLLGNYHAGGSGDDSMKLARMVAAGMESRRHMLRRTFESKIFKPMVAANEMLNDLPKLRFHPKKIGLDFDANFASFLMDLRQMGDLSRDSMLSQFDFDQDDEALKRTREKERFDDIFETTVPGAPAPGGDPASNVAKKAAGRRLGGTKNGGGRAPGTGQGQKPKNVRKRSDGSQNQTPVAAEDTDE